MEMELQYPADTNDAVVRSRVLQLHFHLIVAFSFRKRALNRSPFLTSESSRRSPR